MQLLATMKTLLTDPYFWVFIATVAFIVWNLITAKANNVKIIEDVVEKDEPISIQTLAKTLTPHEVVAPAKAAPKAPKKPAGPKKPVAPKAAPKKPTAPKKPRTKKPATTK